MTPIPVGLLAIFTALAAGTPAVDLPTTAPAATTTAPAATTTVPAATPPAPPATYLLAVGSNRGLAGAAELSCAEESAQRVVRLFTELGGVSASRARLLLGPRRADMVEVLDEVSRSVSSSAGAARLVVYFAGHAQADALQLEGEVLELDTLAAHLPHSDLIDTFVLLDVMSPSRAPVAPSPGSALDFAASARAALSGESVAVLAVSRWPQERYQAPELGVSWTTALLTAALRGAADQDRDRRVTLLEAVRFVEGNQGEAAARGPLAHQTLTAVPASVGQLELPADWSGQVSVRRPGNAAPVVRVDKPAGAAMQLALVPGAYEVLSRSADQELLCALDVAVDSSAPLVRESCRARRVADPTGAPSLSLGEQRRLALFDYERQKREPAIAAILSLQPLAPVSLGYLYVDEWWPKGAIYNAVELGLQVVSAAGVAAYMMFVLPTTMFPCQPGDTACLEGQVGSIAVGLGIASASVVASVAGLGLKIWEAVDTYQIAEQKNEALAARLLELDAAQAEEEWGVADSAPPAVGDPVASRERERAPPSRAGPEP